MKRCGGQFFSWPPRFVLGSFNRRTASPRTDRNADPVGVGERVRESHQSRPDLTSPWTMATDVSKVSRGGCAARIALSEAGSNSVVRSGVAAILMTAAQTMWQTPTGKGNACGRRNRVGYE